MIQLNSEQQKVKPLCPAFNECGGCLYQDLSYDDELLLKEQKLKDLLSDSIDLNEITIDPVIASPKPYHYRNRMDLRLLKTKEQKIFIGFSPKDKFGVVPVEECAIASKELSGFIPELKKQAIAILPKHYRLANLVVRTGDDGRVYWGGIGKRSLKQSEDQYLWTQIDDYKIYYALETFFQTNLSILPLVISKIKSFPIWGQDQVFYDLYGGVGLFSICLSEMVQKSYLIEENIASIQLAQYNKEQNKLTNVEIIHGRVEDEFKNVSDISYDNAIGMIDPPRAGLSSTTRALLDQPRLFKHLLYLSCNPESLARDLKQLTKQNWAVERIIPFDFFPQTKHLETLVWLKNI